MTFPVGANGKNINIEPFYIVYFLSFVFFNNNFVGNTRLPYTFYALNERLLYVYLSTCTVEIVGGNAHDKVISQRLCPLQQAYMAFVNEVEGAVSNYFLHGRAL